MGYIFFPRNPSRRSLPTHVYVISVHPVHPGPLNLRWPIRNGQFPIPNSPHSLTPSPLHPPPLRALSALRGEPGYPLRRATSAKGQRRAESSHGTEGAVRRLISRRSTFERPAVLTGFR